MKKCERNEGFTLIELLIVVAIIGIIAAIAIPGLLRARQSGNEASAIGSLRTVNSAQATYAASCGGGGYAQSFLDLITPPPGGVPFIGLDLTPTAGPNVTAKAGYTLTITPNGAPNMGLTILAQNLTCNMAAQPAIAGYYVFATPITPGTTGQRSFATDMSATLFQNNLGGAIPNPIAIAGNVTILN